MSRLLISGLALACLALPASAHVTLEKSDAAAGQPYKGVLRVGHGCDGSATTSLSVEIPDGVVGVKPMPKPGWTLATEQGAYPAPVAVYGEKLASGVRRITWSGGRLLDSEYDEFTFVGQLAPTLAGSVWFPVLQTCEKGEMRWTETPQPGQTARDLRTPAALLRVAAAEPKAVQAGALRIEQAWSRATPGGANVGAGYLRVTNTGASADRLLGGSTDIAARIEPHDMKLEDGVMKMRELTQGVEIPPGATVELKPGGMHLMILGLKEPLKAGTSFQAQLQFEKAGTTPVTFRVQPIGAPAPGGAPAEPEMDHSMHMQAK